MEENTPYTEHNHSNVYISAFITGYSRLKLFDEALDPLQHLVLYFDVDSVIYVSPTGTDLMPVDQRLTLSSLVVENEIFRSPKDFRYITQINKYSISNLSKNKCCTKH